MVTFFTGVLSYTCNNPNQNDNSKSKLFQQKRDESGLEGDPAIEMLEWVGGAGEFK